MVWDGLKRKAWIWVLIGFMLIGANGCEKKKPQSEQQWYIVPPSEYEHLASEREDEVMQWVQGMPEPSHYTAMTSKKNIVGVPDSVERLIEQGEEKVKQWLPDKPASRYTYYNIESPYTFDEWVERGKKNDVEKVLIDFCDHYPGIVSLDQIIFALRQVATLRCLPTMCRIAEDPSYDYDQQMQAFEVLCQLRVPEAYPSMEKAYYDIEKKLQYEGGEHKASVKMSLLSGFAYLGDMRSTAIFDKESSEPNRSEYWKNTLQSYREELDKQQYEYIKRWLYRYPYIDTVRYKLDIPPYPSVIQWANAGRMIPNIEEKLIEMYKAKTFTNYSGMLDSDVLVFFHAICELGNVESIPFLEAEFTNQSLGFNIKNVIMDALCKIGGQEEKDFLRNCLEDNQNFQGDELPFLLNENIKSTLEKYGN